MIGVDCLRDPFLFKLPSPESILIGTSFEMWLSLPVPSPGLLPLLSG